MCDYCRLCQACSPCHNCSAFLQCGTEAASEAPSATGTDCVPGRLLTKQAVDGPWPQGPEFAHSCSKSDNSKHCNCFKIQFCYFRTSRSMLKWK